MQKIGQLLLGIFSYAALAGPASATSVPHLSFEDLVDQSELIVSGQVTRSWAAWDSEHKYIWTHSEVAVSGAQKGNPGATVIISEPGGILGDRGMAIAGAVGYAPGENVLTFLQRMPNGYLRTTGWGQGKYLVDAHGRLHGGESLKGIELLQAGKTQATATSLKSLEGMGLTDLSTRIAARIRVRQGRKQQ